MLNESLICRINLFYVHFVSLQNLYIYLFVFNIEDISTSKVSSLKEQKKLFSSAWVLFLQFKVSLVNVYTNIL